MKLTGSVPTCFVHAVVHPGKEDKRWELLVSQVESLSLGCAVDLSIKNRSLSFTAEVATSALYTPEKIRVSTDISNQICAVLVVNIVDLDKLKRQNESK